MTLNDLGDFQTPPELVRDILGALGSLNNRWSRVLEPTCGQGNFIRELLRVACPPKQIYGLEVQSRYVEAAAKVLPISSSAGVVIKQANIFELDLRQDLEWAEQGPLLVVGNPPWVTNATLGSIDSKNLPRKRNLKALHGIDAMTGASNFDIAESIWIKLLTELAPLRLTIALLCKTGVARNVLAFARAAALPLKQASLFPIDAKRWFGVSVDACLFVVDMNAVDSHYEMTVFRDLISVAPVKTVGFAGDQMIADTDAYERAGFAHGRSQITWRQGIKHDASSIMELRSIKGELFNKLDQHVDVEDDHVFPLIKSTTLFHGLKQRSDARVIVTQTKIGEDTSILRSKAPRLWTYLSHHRDVFARRRSSIYTGGPPYAMFGVGEYSFASYKVGVSGLHKEARFRTIGPIDGRPAMLDDTCYFAACSSLRQAALLASLLNLPQTADLLQALVFWDAKRPITKRVLQQIDVLALLKHAPRDELLSRAAEEFAQWTDVSTDDHGWTRDDLARCLLGVGSRGDSDEQLALAL